ncbi:hypothetical protein GCM10009825_22100 [Arthrobacter humicola]|uniref:Uncharacterized protein n=1 Tax=Arthrobacter humicola TaxID=409291 RepID=A0ABP5KS66_9MICC
MIVTWNGEYVGHTGFNVTADDYDGEPRFRSFWFDAAPKNRHPDREAVAAFLVFSSAMGGLVNLPHKFSPAVDSAMRSIASPVPVVFSPIEYYPKALPGGSRPLNLSWSGIEAASTDETTRDDTTYLRIERSDETAGSLRTLRGLTMSSNAWLHSDGRRGHVSSIRPYLAAAVLFAEDLDADSIRIPGDYDQESQEWKDLVYLLGTARLGLEVARP